MLRLKVDVTTPVAQQNLEKPNFPEVKKHPMGEFKEPLFSLLSPSAKLTLIQEIRKKDSNSLEQTLVVAATSGFSFPKPISDKLTNLQLVSKENAGNALVRDHTSTQKLMGKESGRKKLTVST